MGKIVAVTFDGKKSQIIANAYEPIIANGEFEGVVISVSDHTHIKGSNMPHTAEIDYEVPIIGMTDKFSLQADGSQRHMFGEVYLVHSKYEKSSGTKDSAKYFKKG